MKNFRIYDRKIYKVEFCVKKYDGLVSPVRLGYGQVDYIDSRKKADIYVKKTLKSNVVKELKTGKKIPVIYEKSLKNACNAVYERKVKGSLSAPYFVLIRTSYFDDARLYSNFTSDISVEKLERYSKIDYKTFNYELNRTMVGAEKYKSYYFKWGVIPVSSPWREKVNVIRQKLNNKNQEKAFKKQLVKNMKEQRTK